MTIIFCCTAAMSTSLFVEKMKQALTSKEVKIITLGINEIDSKIQADVILLAPQMKYARKTLEKRVAPIPIIDISMRDYGMMDCKNIVKYICDLLNP